MSSWKRSRPRCWVLATGGCTPFSAYTACPRPQKSSDLRCQAILNMHGMLKPKVFRHTYVYHICIYIYIHISTADICGFRVLAWVLWGGKLTADSSRSSLSDNILRSSQGFSFTVRGAIPSCSSGKCFLPCGVNDLQKSLWSRYQIGVAGYGMAPMFVVNFIHKVDGGF